MSRSSSAKPLVCFSLVPPKKWQTMPRRYVWPENKGDKDLSLVQMKTPFHIRQRTKQPSAMFFFYFREDGAWAQMAITLSPVSSSGQKRWTSPLRSWHNRSSNMHDSWKWLCNPPPGTHSTMYRHTCRWSSLHLVSTNAVSTEGCDSVVDLLHT